MKLCLPLFLCNLLIFLLRLVRLFRKLFLFHSLLLADIGLVLSIPEAEGCNSRIGVVDLVLEVDRFQVVVMVLAWVVAGLRGLELASLMVAFLERVVRFGAEAVRLVLVVILRFLFLPD